MAAVIIFGSVIVFTLGFIAWAMTIVLRIHRVKVVYRDLKPMPIILREARSYTKEVEHAIPDVDGMVRNNVKDLLANRAKEYVRMWKTEDHRGMTTIHASLKVTP